MKQYLEVGEFVTTHGVAGELRLYPWSDSPAFLAGFSKLYLGAGGTQAFDIVQARPHKNVCLVKLAGVDSIAAARPFIGKTAYIARAEVKLPAGRFFVQDILGAKVLHADTGRLYGTVAAVTHPGRHDVYEVLAPGGETHLFPAAEPFLVRVDVQAGEVHIRPIEGMFPEEDA